MKCCFMFGHSICSEDILPKLEKIIEEFILSEEVMAFYVGNRGEFDRLAATAVRNIKKRFPEIKLYLLLAYHPAERTVYLPNGFDNSYYPPLEGVPQPYAIVRANRYMVDTADLVICYVNHPGNARNLLEYAQRRHKKHPFFIENIALK